MSRFWQGYELVAGDGGAVSDELAAELKRLGLTTERAASGVHLTPGELSDLKLGNLMFESPLGWEHLGRMLRDVAAGHVHTDCPDCAEAEPRARTIAPKVARRREPTGRAAQRAAAPPELGPLFDRRRS